MDTVILVFNLLINLWLLLIVQRHLIRKQLPWFVRYIAWAVLSGFAYLVAELISSRLYTGLYWWVEAVEITLIVAAVRESFLRIFQGFTLMPWFRWTVSGVIAAVVVYSARKAIHFPPVQGTRLADFVFGTEFLFRWGIAGIGLLTVVLTWLLSEPANTRENAVVTGFMLASGTFVAAVVIVSFSGTKYLFLSKYLPSVGYFMAAFLWIWVFSRPVEGVGFKEFGIGPEDLLKTMRRYRDSVRQIRGKE